MFPPRNRAALVLPPWQDPLYVLNIPNAGPYMHDPSGYKAHHVGPGVSEGWKFHISSHPHLAEQLATVVLPVLTNLNVSHKYLELNTLRTRVGGAVGKFIAYYPISPQEAHATAQAVENAINMAAVQVGGPVIGGEKAFGNLGILYTRYGSYHYEFVKGPPNEQTKSMDPPRGVRAYHAGTVRPSWIVDIDQDQSPGAFPSYDARRTLHGLQESAQLWTN